LQKGRSPIEIAALHGRIDAVSALANAGAITSPKTGKKSPCPLIYAIRGRHENVVKFLITNCNVNLNHRCIDGLTALTAALSIGSSAITSLVVEAGAKLNQIDPEGRHILFLATENGMDLVVDRIMEEDPRAPLARLPNGQSPLHVAAANGMDLIAAKLIAWGFDPDEADHDGSTPFQMSAQTPGDYNVLALFVMNGCDPWRRDRRGRNVFSLLDQWGTELVGEFLECPEIMRKIEERRNQKNGKKKREEKRCLHRSISKGMTQEERGIFARMTINNGRSNGLITNAAVMEARPWGGSSSTDQFRKEIRAAIAAWREEGNRQIADLWDLMTGILHRSKEQSELKDETDT
jgi:ankyrin repeat protein